MAEHTTTILGKTYQGKPGMGTVACYLKLLEETGREDEARRYLLARDTINRVWGQPPHDLQEDMTDIPMEGMQIYGRKA